MLRSWGRVGGRYAMVGVTWCGCCVSEFPRRSSRWGVSCAWISCGQVWPRRRARHRPQCDFPPEWCRRDVCRRILYPIPIHGFSRGGDGQSVASDIGMVPVRLAVGHASVRGDPLSWACMCSRTLTAMRDMSFMWITRSLRPHRSGCHVRRRCVRHTGSIPIAMGMTQSRKESSWITH